MGHYQTFGGPKWMSALPPEADISVTHRHVRKGPYPDSCATANYRLFDHLVGACKQRGWNFEPKRLRCLEIDRQLEFGRLLYR